MHFLVTSLNYVKQKLFQNCYLSSTFCSKTRTKPKPSSRIRTEIFENNSFWGKNKSGVGGLTSSLPLVSDQITSNSN